MEEVNITAGCFRFLNVVFMFIVNYRIWKIIIQLFKIPSYSVQKSMHCSKMVFFDSYMIIMSSTLGFLYNIKGLLLRGRE